MLLVQAVSPQRLLQLLTCVARQAMQTLMTFLKPAGQNLLQSLAYTS